MVTIVGNFSSFFLQSRLIEFRTTTNENFFASFSLYSPKDELKYFLWVGESLQKCTQKCWFVRKFDICEWAFVKLIWNVESEWLEMFFRLEHKPLEQLQPYHTWSTIHFFVLCFDSHFSLSIFRIIQGSTSVWCVLKRILSAEYVFFLFSTWNFPVKLLVSWLEKFLDHQFNTIAKNRYSTY